MTKRFIVDDAGTLIDMQTRDTFDYVSDVCGFLNELHEENAKLKNSLREFEVFESNRIKGAVVTNDDFSVTLHSNNEAYMVCNMLNRFIRSVKNGNKD